MLLTFRILYKFPNVPIGGIFEVISFLLVFISIFLSFWIQIRDYTLINGLCKNIKCEDIPWRYLLLEFMGHSSIHYKFLSYCLLQFFSTSLPFKHWIRIKIIKFVDTYFINIYCIKTFTLFGFSFYWLLIFMKTVPSVLIVVWAVHDMYCEELPWHHFHIMYTVAIMFGWFCFGQAFIKQMLERRNNYLFGYSSSRTW